MSSKPTLVSVVVPMYNVENYIEQCLTSIFAQTVRPLEVIVIDDGSTDSSLARARQVVGDATDRDTDLLAQVISQPNSGVSVARNTGLGIAHGEFICFVDSDDWLDPQFLANHLTTALDFDADFTISTSAGSPTKRSLTPHLWTDAYATSQLLIADIPIGCWNKLYRRSFLVSNNLQFRADLYMGEGMYFICECAKLAEVIVALGPAGYHYRTDNRESATTVPSIEKMRNALHSIDEIELMWDGRGDEIGLALAYQRLWTLFAGLVNAVSLGESESSREFSHAIRRIKLNVPLEVEGDRTRRTKACLFRVAPVTMARIASHRGKFATDRAATL